MTRLEELEKTKLYKGVERLLDHRAAVCASESNQDRKELRSRFDQAFMEAWETFDWDGPTKFSTWLCHKMRAQVSSHRKRRRRAPAQLNEDGETRTTDRVHPFDRLWADLGDDSRLVLRRLLVICGNLTPKQVRALRKQVLQDVRKWMRAMGWSFPRTFAAINELREAVE